MERVIVSGESMYPTLNDADVCIVWKLDDEPKLNDIVIAKVNGFAVIKRVVGLPGDVLSVADGELVVNGNKVAEFNFRTEDFGVLTNGYTVPQDSYFIMGDNREKSYDSREYGAIFKDQIEGIVFLKLYPFTKITVYSR